MRRFLESLPGRVVCHVVAVALVAPFTVLASMRQANAQGGLVNDVRWAVVDFVDGSKNRTATAYGKEGAERVQDELTKYRETARVSDRFELVPRDTIDRAIETLSLEKPVVDTTSLLRLAQEVQASRLVTGTIQGVKINNVNGGKQAVVGVVIKLIDAASGLAVNGAAVEGKSAIRSGNADDAVIVGEALSQAAAKAVPDLVKRQLTGAVLNTRGDEALISEGSRTGFKPGMNVVVLRGPRGREVQVATARVESVEIDSSTIRATRSIKGISPGDKVAVIWDAPTLVPTGGAADGGYKVQQPRKKVNAGAAVSVLLVLGLIALILSNGRGNTNFAVDEVVAQATTDAGGAGAPAIEIAWRRELFFRGNQSVQWLVFRDDVQNNPVAVADGALSKAIDTANQRTINYYNNTRRIDELICDGLSSGSADVDGLIVGRPYQYSVASVYRVSSLDLPTGATTGATTGSTGLNTGSTGATTGQTGATTGQTGATTGQTGATTGQTGATTGQTGATTGQTGTTGASFCYFRTDAFPASGFATALSRSTLLSPSANETVTNFRNFTFTSVATAAFPIRIGYVLQFCKSPTFNNGKVYTSPEKVTVGTQGQSIAISARFPGDSLTQFLDDTIGAKTSATDTQVWWRVGARNVEDNPGPKPDPATGLRYVFSAAQPFNRP